MAVTQEHDGSWRSDDPSMGWRLDTWADDIGLSTLETVTLTSLLACGSGDLGLCLCYRYPCPHYATHWVPTAQELAKRLAPLVPPDDRPEQVLVVLADLDPDRWRVARVNWTCHHTWTHKLDDLAEVIDALRSALARAGLPQRHVEDHAVICAATFEPAGPGLWRLRPWAERPPIVP